MKNEMYILCRKPLQEKTIADNVLVWGTGGINIDKSRIGTYNENRKNHTNDEKNVFLTLPNRIYSNIEGRFPANLIHDGSDEVMEEFDKAGYSKKTGGGKKYKRKRGGFMLDNENIQEANAPDGYTDEGSAARYFWKTTD